MALFFAAVTIYLLPVPIDHNLLVGTTVIMKAVPVSDRDAGWTVRVPL